MDIIYNPIDNGIHQLQFHTHLELTTFKANFKKNVKQLCFEMKDENGDSDDEYCEYWQPKTKKGYINFLTLRIKRIFLYTV